MAKDIAVVHHADRRTDDLARDVRRVAVTRLDAMVIVPRRHELMALPHPSRSKHADSCH